MCCTPLRCVLVCVHASPTFVAKCQTGTLSLVCGDTTSGCLLRNYCISCYVCRKHMSIPADLEEFVVRPSSPPHRTPRSRSPSTSASRPRSEVLHLTQFCIRRQTRYQPYGPWPHVPESVWAQEEATVVEEENDDGVCCQLCGHRPGDISECGTCHLNMCASCMPLHSCTL